MRAMLKRIAPVLAAAAVVFVSLHAETPTLGTVESITVHGKSLEGNLDGDSPDRNVIVYLPPSYKTDTTRRYPVVYLLHGYGLQASRWMTLFKIEAGLNAAMSRDPKEMIVVNPDCYSFYDGCFYGKSAATGDWETFVADELVKYIDSHYRTLAKRESRGLGGHSMGGYGTLRIAMKRPDVFGAMYALSACCAMDQAEVNDQMKTSAGYTTRDQVAALRYPNKGTLARAAAWSANPNNPPFFLDLPIKDGQPRSDVAAKWHENSLIPMMEKYGSNLKKYAAVKFDVGTMDNLLAANQQIDAAMTKAGIRHTFETYEGDHNGKIAERLETKVVPFFSTALAFK